MLMLSDIRYSLNWKGFDLCDLFVDLITGSDQLKLPSTT